MLGSPAGVAFTNRPDASIPDMNGCSLRSVYRWPHMLHFSQLALGGNYYQYPHVTDNGDMITEVKQFAHRQEVLLRSWMETWPFSPIAPG